MQTFPLIPIKHTAHAFLLCASVGLSIFALLTSQRKSFCLASELSSCRASAKSFCFSTPGGISLSRDIHSQQTFSISWQIPRYHDRDYGILPCYSEPTTRHRNDNSTLVVINYILRQSPSFVLSHHRQLPPGEGHLHERRKILVSSLYLV